MINIKSLSEKIKKDENLYKNILIFYTGNATTNSVKPLYFIISKISGYIKESNGKNICQKFPLIEAKIH